MSVVCGYSERPAWMFCDERWSYMQKWRMSTIGCVCRFGEGPLLLVCTGVEIGQCRCRERLLSGDVHKC